jgi:hypothetical protein
MSEAGKKSKMEGKLYIGSKTKNIAQKVMDDLMPNKEDSDKNLTDEERELFYFWLKQGDSKPIELAIRLALASLLARLRGVPVRQAAAEIQSDQEVV